MLNYQSALIAWSSRAAKELRTHDIACRVLQSGPTSLARCAELCAREDAARRAVGTEAEAAAFASLKSLVDAERRRIHRLFYCILLRCMVMPIRFEYLLGVRSTPEVRLQQPVPQEFYADDGGENAYLDLGPMYLVWLHRHMESIDGM